MKTFFYSSQEKKWLNFILAMVGIGCSILLYYLLLKKVGKIHDLEFVCLILSGIIGLVVFCLFVINGISKPFAIFFSGVLIISIFVVSVTFTSSHHNLHIRNVIQTRGIIVSVERTKQYKVYGYIVKYVLNGKEHYTQTQSTLLPHEVRDSADVYYSPDYSEYHYAVLIPLKNE